MVCAPRQLRNFKIIRPFLQAGQTIYRNGVFRPGLQNNLVSSVHGGKIVWCLLSTVAKTCGVFCSPWQKGVVSFVHPGKKCLVSFGSGVFCPAPQHTCAHFSEKCWFVTAHFHSIHLRAYFSQVNVTIALIVIY